MGKLAFIFPGQGAQYVGMGKDFYDQFSESRVIYEQAGELLSFSVTDLCFTENENLNRTEYTQAAMITTIAAMLAHIETMGIQPDVCAGLSLGEYAALIQSKAINAMDAIALVRKRGIYMQEAVPVGQGKMAAVLGMENSQIEEILSKVSGSVSIANYNCPGQAVISGESQAVDDAVVLLQEAKAKRIVPLNVSGPFHSALLVPAGEKLRKELEQVKINDPIIPYLANVTADYVTSKKDIVSLLANQVSHSVRWQQSVERMILDGVDTFVEIGPGKTLSSFLRKIDRSKKVINIETIHDFDKLELL